jgi:hypothetical protein
MMAMLFKSQKSYVGMEAAFNVIETRHRTEKSESDRLEHIVVTRMSWGNTNCNEHRDSLLLQRMH